MGTVRRVFNEIKKDWTEEYQDSVSIWLHKQNPYELMFIIYFSENYPLLEVNIDFTASLYPFKPPKIYIGCEKKDYISCLPTSWKFASQLLGNKCACCNSILCHWPGPKVTIKDMVTEVKENFILKIRMMEIAHCRKIVEKKLGVNYVPIEEFL
jgi:hypothetical protein